ncbi:asr2135 [Nostoc sp. PCC 7120 = FACHB-418]|nr:asr2135 [Nostoc sp. PCC 7120 = FACHB-418]
MITEFSLYVLKTPAILILARSCSSTENLGIVMIFERSKRARAFARTGFVRVRAIAIVP